MNFFGNRNDSWIWVLIIIILIFDGSLFGCGCNGCGCNNCGNSCNNCCD